VFEDDVTVLTGEAVRMPATVEGVDDSASDELLAAGAGENGVEGRVTMEGQGGGVLMLVGCSIREDGLGHRPLLRPRLRRHPLAPLRRDRPRPRRPSPIRDERLLARPPRRRRRRRRRRTPVVDHNRWRALIRVRHHHPRHHPLLSIIMLRRRAIIIIQNHTRNYHWGR